MRCNGLTMAKCILDRSSLNLSVVNAVSQESNLFPGSVALPQYLSVLEFIAPEQPLSIWAAV